MPFEAIADRLEANAVVIQNGVARIVIVTFDLLYVGDLLRAALVQALRLHVEPDQLFLAASHTHFAPATDPTLPKLGCVESDYVNMVAERVANLVMEMLRGPFESLTAGVAFDTANHAVNRRSTGWRIGRRFPFLHHGVQMRPNPAGPKDETIGVIRLGDRAVIWNYACHPVFMPRMNHVSADFVGQVRNALRQQFGANTTVLFWQGFSGDVYPSFASTMVGPIARIKRLLFRTPDAVDAAVWRDWCNRLARRVVDVIASIVPTEIRGPLQSERTTIALRDLLGVESPDKGIAVHQLRIGNDIHVFAISAEMVCEHLAVIREQFHKDRIFCVSCIDAVFGYFPTTRMVNEGGYEGGGFFPYFSLHGQFPNDIESFLRKRILRIN
jgi:hypothetical protein